MINRSKRFTNKKQVSVHEQSSPTTISSNGILGDFHERVQSTRMLTTKHSSNQSKQTTACPAYYACIFSVR